MLPRVGRSTMTAGLVVVLTLIVGASKSHGQGYVYSPGGGYYYTNGSARGYTYPSYAYGYWVQGRSTLPSGYYVYPAGGGYYYQYYAPATAPASPAPAPAVTSREAALEARVTQLEATVNSLRTPAAPPAAVPSYRYYPTGDTRIERDARYPNWSFDYNDWVAHNL